MSASRPRLLLVDDEPTNIQVLAAALGERYELRFATDGRRALELAFATRFDLVLLDVVMPGMDGFAVLAALKADPRTQAVPVIFVTSMGESDDEARGLTLGAVDYIAKPANPAIVRARVATHLELKRQRDLLERHAFVDGLTGVANRRRFDQEWPQRVARAAAGGEALGVLLIDIDCFKAYNDHHGHLAGDDCLRRVAAALAAAAPEDALLARYGGEEFVLVLADAAVAAQGARLLAAVRALALPHAASSAAAQVTISVGALARRPAPGLEPQALLAAVDALLYQAKHGGRDRCVCRHADDECESIVERGVQS
jgi:diguanylate cyclase (GGDEF)-like protein